MRQQFLLPDLGEGLTEAVLVEWRVTPGESVALNETIAEVETAKALVELPSPYAGVVQELHAAPGETITVGSVLIAFDVATATGDETERAPLPNLVGYGAAQDSAGVPRRRRTAPAPAATATAPDPRPAAGTPEERGETRIPVRGVRKAMAAAMVASAFTAPHATTFLSVDVTTTNELIAMLRTDAAEGPRVGILAVVARAVCLTLPRHPALNATWERVRRGGVVSPLRSEHPVKAPVWQPGACAATRQAPRFVLALPVGLQLRRAG